MSHGKLFTVTDIAEAYEEGWNDRHAARYGANGGTNPPIRWNSSNSRKKANKAVEEDDRIASVVEKATKADPTRNMQQIAAMAEVLRTCRWFKPPEGVPEDKAMIFAERMYDAAIAMRYTPAIEPIEHTPAYKTITVTMKTGNPAVMLADALTQVLKSAEDMVTLAQAEAALTLAHSTMTLPVIPVMV